MEDRDEAIWAGLGSIDAFIATENPSPTASPAHTPPASPWAWSRPTDVLQIRLDDGEPTEAGPIAPDIDAILLPVATGRIERKLPLSAHPPPPDLLPPHPKKEPIFSKPEPVLIHHDPAPVLSKSLPPKTPVQRLPRQPQPQQPQPQPQPHPQPPVPAPQRPLRPPVTPVRSPHQVQRKPFSPRGAPQPTADAAAPGSLQEKRDREAKQFPMEVLGTLDGTTSAEVRKMNAAERELVHYRRKLRNRESARRSRQKRQATLAELQEEINEIMQITCRMIDVGCSLHDENVRLRDRLSVANAEIKGMRTIYNEPRGSASDPAIVSSAALKMKLGG